MEELGAVLTFTSGLVSMETTHKPLNVLRCKVAVVGDACVGKTALVECFHSNNYPKNYLMTSWVNFCVKQVYNIF
jgi:transport family protein 27